MITPSEEHPIVAVVIYQENNCVRDVNPREGGGGERGRVACLYESPAVLRGSVAIMPIQKHPMVALQPTLKCTCLQICEL